MKLCVSLYSLHPYLVSKKMDVTDALEFLHKQGVQYVELLDLYLPTPESRAQAKAVLARYGMKAGAYAASNEFVCVTPAELEKQIAGLKEACRIAAEFGAPVLRVFAGNQPQDGLLSYDQSVTQITGSLKACIPAACECGVKLCLENHGLFAGKSEQVCAILDSVASPAMTATVDTGNFLMVNEEPLAAVQSLAGRIGHVHFKDMKQVDAGGFAALDGRRYIGTAFGEGEVPLSAIVNMLAQSGYDGCVSIEYEAPGEDGCREALAQSIRYTRSLLESL